MTILRVYLLGGMALAWDGEPIPMIPSVTARSLLAFLITYRQRAHTRDLLAGTFWPDLSDKSARRQLSQALWRVQSALKPHPVLCLESDTIQLNPNLSIWVDIDEFNHFFSKSSQEAIPNLSLLQECIDLYCGDYLAGYYQDWVLSERERIRNLYLLALGKLVSGYKQLGNYQQALVYAQRLVNQEVWSEEAQRDVMHLNNLLGNSHEALKQYQVFRQRLVAELGVEPMPETQALAQEIVKQVGSKESAWLPSPASTNLAPFLDHPDRIPLVGRKRELAWLLSQLEAGASGEGGMILLCGEAGIGKTRLLQELAHNAEWRDLLVAWGHCYELAGPPAYQPLLEIFRSHLPVLKKSNLAPIWQGELAKLLPEMEVGRQSVNLQPDQEQNRMLEAISQGFQALVQTSPALVILEDAQWIDPASLTALRFLLPRLKNLPLLLVISMRWTDLSAVQAAAISVLENTRLPKRFDLGCLNLEQTAELVQRSLELPQPPINFSSRLFSETEGNPFFLTETLRSLLDEGLLYRNQDGQWSTPWDESDKGYAEMPLPDGIVHGIEHRYQLLSGSMQEAINLAAVIGRSVVFQLWRQSSDFNELELFNIADELCKRGLILRQALQDDRKDFNSDDFTFAHDQIRRVIYDHLAAPRLRTYHQRVAEAITSLFPTQVEALAYHWRLARVWDQAANYHQLAGERAWAVYAHTDAKEHFLYCLQSLNHLQVSPDPNRLYMIHSTMQKIYDLEGGRTNQGQQLSTLAELAEKLDDDRRRAEVALWRARQAASMSDLPKTIHDANLAIDLAVAAQDVIIQSEGYWEWGWALLMQGQHEKAKEQFEKSLILAKTAKILPLEADGLHALGTIGLVTGDYDEAKKQFHHVLEISKKIDIRPRAAKSLANLGYIATAQGDHAASRNFSEQALCIHRETGEQKGVAIAIQHLADELIFEGDYASARSYLLEAMNIQETIQAHENLGVTLRSIGMLYHQLGDYSRAKEYYQRALRIFTDSGVRWYQGQALAFISLLYHHLGDNQKAVLTGQEGLIVAREINDRLGEGWLLDSLGHAFWGLGQLDRAAESYQLALSLRQKLNETHKTTESLAGLAHIALHQREFEKARQYVEQILEVGRLRGFAGTNEPFRIQLTCYQVLEACHDLRADEVIAKVYHQLLIYKETIKDVTLENSFLENVAAHREIIAAYRNKQKSIPGYQVQVSLPRVDIPSGHPIRAEENILITWTLHAPGDESFPTRQGCRQHRLLRLLEEAQAQGGAPNCDHLAQVLGVSRRTIERDLAALRNNPIKLPPTGGKMS